MVARFSGDLISLVDVATGEVRASRRFRDAGRQNCGSLLAFDRAGLRLLFTVAGWPSGQSMVDSWDASPVRWWVWDLVTDQVSSGVTRGGYLPVIDLHPDGDLLAIVERTTPEGEYFDACDVESPGPGSGVHTRLVVVESTTGAQRLTRELDDFVPTAVSWSPSGRRLLLHDGRSFRLVDAATGRPLAASPRDVAWSRPRFRPGGGALVARSEPGEVIVLGSLDGQVLSWLGDGEARRFEGATWSGNGERLIFRTGRRAFEVLDVRSGQQLAPLELASAGAADTSRYGDLGSWSHDARAVIDTIATGPGVHHWDALTGEYQGMLVPAPYSLSELSLFDAVAAVRTEDGALAFWDVERGRHLWERTDELEERGVQGVDPRPGGGYVLWAEGAILWDGHGAPQATPCPRGDSLWWDARGLGHTMWEHDDGAISSCRLEPDAEVRSVPYMHLSNDDGSLTVDLEAGGVAVVRDFDTLEARSPELEVERVTDVSRDGRRLVDVGADSIDVIDTMTKARSVRIAAWGEHRRPSRNVLRERSKPRDLEWNTLRPSRAPVGSTPLHHDAAEILGSSVGRSDPRHLARRRARRGLGRSCDRDRRVRDREGGLGPESRGPTRLLLLRRRRSPPLDPRTGTERRPDLGRRDRTRRGVGTRPPRPVGSLARSRAGRSVR